MFTLYAAKLESGVYIQRGEGNWRTTEEPKRAKLWTRRADAQAAIDRFRNTTGTVVPVTVYFEDDA